MVERTYWCGQENKKQNSADVYTSGSAYRKVKIAVLDSVNKQSGYCVCM